MRLLKAIEAAAKLGVGTEEPDDRDSKEYSRGVKELLASCYWPDNQFAEARDALEVIFRAVDGDE
ncbi:hypothetical protein KIV64_gp45 [Mycobacterium phage DroogsArmy]|uniref:Uncharacterized protein n=1 Tax=Mycobacterium phage DroogsArmy TaxID=2744011 RepID=A0A6N0A5M1_9CAUD|nr:hypothetical protein KIV64_gp45 [Mycobacterium phage DroogsArmy]QKO02443.1 hypothetical protein SEA_DROOGSARMY_47 [Mycobacterium phage DroogsArmy]